MVYQVWSIVPKYLETVELGSTQLTNCRGFCWSKVLLPEYPCWWQLAHSDLGEDARVLSGVTYTVFIPYIITVCACDPGHYKNLYCIVLYNIGSSVLWCCWLGGKKGIRPVKTEWWGTGAVFCLEPGANDLHMVQLMHCHSIISCSSKIQNGLPFWCRLTQVVLEKRSLNRCNSSCSA